jgi:hypothetical protein
MHNNGTNKPDETPIRLSPEQMEMVRLAEIDFENGEKGYTAEQVMEHARAKVRAWLPPSQSA